MKLFDFLRPRPTISEQELARGLRFLTLEGAFAMGFFSITTSGFLAAFALALGAALSQAAEGVLRAAEGISPEAVAEVAEALPDELLENRPGEEKK